ncbi:hypothetical protein BH24ACT1_BH24ACT1_06270 [soil metagenome]
MASTEPYQPDKESAAISAALDELIGAPPDDDELVEEQPPNPPRPPFDSGIEEEQDRLNPSGYGA